MAIVKDAQDPKKPVAAPRTTSKEAEPKRLNSRPDDQNDFDPMTITYRDANQQLEELALLGVGGGASDGSSMLSNFLDDSKKLLNFDDIEKLGTLTMWDVLRIDPKDERAMSMPMGQVTDYENGQKYYVVGKDKEKFEARRAAESYLGTSPSPVGGGASKPSDYRVATPETIQKELVASINKAATITGVPPELLGAMAGIESGFNNPKMQKSPTGAIGVVQQTGGYRDTMWKKFGDQVAAHVPEAREAMKDGILTKDEKRSLAFNEDSSFIMVGLRAQELAKQHKLDLNNPKSWGVIYLEHNSGAGSVSRLMKGQMPDAKIMGWNPAIYRGNDTPERVLASTQSKMERYAATYEKMEDGIEARMLASAKPAADAAIAKAATSSVESLKSGAVSSISNTPDSNLDARDLRMAQNRGPAPVIS